MSDEQQTYEAVFEFVENEPIEAVFQINATQSDLSYIHYQDQPSKTWNINHNLSKYPTVTVVSSSGDVVFSDISYVDTNNIIIKFSAAFGGRAYCN